MSKDAMRKAKAAAAAAVTTNELTPEEMREKAVSLLAEADRMEAEAAEKARKEAEAAEKARKEAEAVEKACREAAAAEKAGVKSAIPGGRREIRLAYCLYVDGVPVRVLTDDEVKAFDEILPGV